LIVTSILGLDLQNNENFSSFSIPQLYEWAWDFLVIECHTNCQSAAMMERRTDLLGDLSTFKAEEVIEEHDIHVNLRRWQLVLICERATQRKDPILKGILCASHFSRVEQP
jgi:hypothetical protein